MKPPGELPGPPPRPPLIIHPGEPHPPRPYLPLASAVILAAFVLLICLHNVKFYIRRKRCAAVAFTWRHRWLGYLGLWSSSCCVVACFWPSPWDRFDDWTRILVGSVWLLLCASRILYLISPAQRQVAYRNAILLGTSLFLTTIVPRYLYPSIWMPRPHGPPGFHPPHIPPRCPPGYDDPLPPPPPPPYPGPPDHHDPPPDFPGFPEPLFTPRGILEIFAASICTVIIPLLTPYHFSATETHPHPSETCSPLSRWWLYSWISSLVGKSYTHGGDLKPEDILPIHPESSPEKWLEEYLELHERCGSFRATLWKLFRHRLAITAFFMILCGFFEFIGAVGLQQLLLFFQRSPEAKLKPEVSIFLFGICPILRGLCMQTFEYFATHTIGHWKALIVSAVYQRLLQLPAGENIEVGQLQNLISGDIDRLGTLRYTIMTVFMVPVELTVASVMLYRTIGWSYIPSLVFLIATRHPLSQFIVKAQGAAQSKILQATDGRIAQMSEAIRHMATIKMLGRAQTFIIGILDKRAKELKALWKKAEVIVTSETLSTACTFVALVLCLCLYTAVSKERLEADVAFTVIAIFNIIKSMLSLAVLGTGQYAQAAVSLGRLCQFLDRPDLPASSFYPTLHNRSRNRIGFQGAAFGVSLADGSPRVLLSDLNVEFVKRGLNVISGPLGCGKTILLQSLLSEQRQYEGTVRLRDAPFEPVAYASQNPWFQNGTIRDNILFGCPFIQQRYRQVIKMCALESDLASFEEGDLKDIGEGGSALSGGQRQRIALARALYSNANTVILDDVLSALDAATATSIVDNCILGPLMEDRTLIIVTDNAKCLKKAHLIVYLADGTIREIVRNTENDASLKDHAEPTSMMLTAPVTPETPPRSLRAPSENAIELTSPRNVDGGKPSPVTLDTNRRGLLGTRYVFKYIRSLGSWPFVLLTLISMLAAQAMDVVLPGWLSYWTLATFCSPPGTAVGFYLGIFSGLGAAQLTLLAASLLLLYRGALKVSRDKHMKLLVTVFGASYSWIVNTPAGEVINRFSTDMTSLDDTLLRSLRPVLETYLSIGLRIMTVSSMVPIFVLPAIIFTGLGIYTGYRYRFASTGAKRLYAASLSPLHHSIAETASGLVTIRAYRAERTLQDRFTGQVEYHVRAWEAVSDLQRWLAVRMDIYASLICFSAASLAFLRPGLHPSFMGLGLTLTTGLCTSLMYLVYLSSLLEVEMNSVQRIDEYIEDVPQDPGEASPDDATPDDWPTHGDVDVEHLTVGYSLDSKEVLKDVSFHAPPGTRVAIVGRTGSGKSSLALSLLRLTTNFSGTIRIDGIDIASLPAERLRQRISLIPQDPTLFNGTLRFNLDLSGTATDEHLQSVLDAVVGTHQWTLDDMVESNGQNFSQGERQLIALARAVVNRSKVVIIDEATASLDQASDARIQTVLRDQFHDCTILAIAHRLDTIVDFDQVLVLDQGRVAQRGHPQTLIEREEGLFYEAYAQQARRTG